MPGTKYINIFNSHSNHMGGYCHYIHFTDGETEAVVPESMILITSCYCSLRNDTFDLGLGRWIESPQEKKAIFGREGNVNYDVV